MGTSASAAVMVGLIGTFAILAFTFLWATATIKPARRHPVTGRCADPYWYSPTGKQDERGITSL